MTSILNGLNLSIPSFQALVKKLPGANVFDLAEGVIPFHYYTNLIVYQSNILNPCKYALISYENKESIEEPILEADLNARKIVPSTVYSLPVIGTLLSGARPYTIFALRLVSITALNMLLCPMGILYHGAKSLGCVATLTHRLATKTFENGFVEGLRWDKISLNARELTRSDIFANLKEHGYALLVDLCFTAVYCGCIPLLSHYSTILGVNRAVSVSLGCVRSGILLAASGEGMKFIDSQRGQELLEGVEFSYVHNGILDYVKNENGFLSSLMLRADFGIVGKNGGYIPTDPHLDANLFIDARYTDEQRAVARGVVDLRGKYAELIKKQPAAETYADYHALYNEYKDLQVEFDNHSRTISKAGLNRWSLIGFYRDKHKLMKMEADLDSKTVNLYKLENPA